MGCPAAAAAAAAAAAKYLELPSRPAEMAVDHLME